MFLTLFPTDSNYSIVYLKYRSMIFQVYLAYTKKGSGAKKLNDLK